MNFTRHGSGERIFIGLHGWAGSREAFEPLAPFIPPDASLFALDLPGCGLSPPPSSWRIDAIVAEIATGIREIVASRGGAGASTGGSGAQHGSTVAGSARGITLIGNCSGAVLALLGGQKLEQDSAARADGYVLIDPFAVMPSYFRLFTVPGIGELAYALAFANPAGRRLTNISLRAKRSARTDLTRFFAGANHGANLRYLRLFGSLTRGDPSWREKLRAVEAQVELVFGTRTFRAVRRSIPLWRELLRDARVTEVPGAGHLPIREAPERLARIIFTEAG